jgi:beta-N-acetylhexosaminidase
VAIVAGLDTKAKVGQLLLIGVQGRGSFPEATLSLVRELGPGGILLFGFNVPDKAADLGPGLASLEDAAAASAAGLPLLVAIDHEGGSVFRFRGGITRPPAPLETGARGPAYARLLGERVGLELRSLGITLVLGPVVERLTAENEAFLGNRSFGREARRVDEVAGAYIEGLGSSGVASVAKHFPGNSFVDPHKALPSIGATRAGFLADYLPRFASAASHGVDAVMLSHVLVPAIDPVLPATLSPSLIALLRGEVGFDGLVITDDLLMKALVQGPRRSAVESLAAGADLLMLSSPDAALPVRAAIVDALNAGKLARGRIDEAASRVIELKLRLGLGSILDPEARARSLAAFPSIAAESAVLLEAAQRSTR